MSNPHMRALLDVSGAHLSVSTHQLLDTWSKITAPIPGFAHHIHGYFFWVPTEDDWALGDDPAELPADLVAMLTYARQQGAEYVLVDGDGPVHDNLPTYWGDEVQGT